ncbi:hypothetical protein MVEN_01460400 [Mycena venus]|uniref:Cytochrome P450 n=1 Tax=Mycena venus TaxID=2733690 RepID=A0A8H7CT37_9AGAR|nr:hypothetical protein MVEN_01460400 [Mycena venus]
MISTSEILLPITAVISYGLYQLAHLLYSKLTYPLRYIIGPKSPSIVFGNVKDLALTPKWRDEYGPIFRFAGLFSVPRLYTSDVKALSHVVANFAIYQRAPMGQDFRRRVLGNGILSATFEDHKHQRQILDRAFGVGQVRLMTQVFVDKAVRLRDIWASQLAQEEKNGNGTRIDVFPWLRRVTLDVIGEAGFGYHFNALDAGVEGNALNDAFTELLHTPQAKRFAMFRLIQMYIPILKLIPSFPGQKIVEDARKQMFAIANGIVTESKSAIIQAGEGEKALGIDDINSKNDLLSVLLKANLSTNIPESQRLSDEDLVAQIPAFLAAGHETTSHATSWALHALSLNHAVQHKLREELLTMSTDNPSMDQLNALPYLEVVLREVMRVYAPVWYLERIAMQDDVLPLSKPYIDKAGKTHETLPIPKGQIIHMPLAAVNTAKEIWGNDAEEFKPERWENIPSATSGIPTVWANLMSFGAGTTNCIGFRFALTETKALLFTLLRAFEFEPAASIGQSGGALQGPVVLSEREKGTQLPLIVKLYNA